MSKNAIARITKLLRQKYWFGGEAVFPWQHPLNKIQNCLAILLDGCLTHKFKVCKNGKLRLMKQNESGGFIRLGLKPLQTITFEDLCILITRRDNHYAGAFMQLSSPVPVPVDMVELREVEMNRRWAVNTMTSFEKARAK
jgi:hypothetical protein